MTELFPQPPGWRVAWEDLDAALPFIHSMRGSPQDPLHHAEGDVWVHTRMVCEQLAAHPAWRALDAADREIVFAAALLHDSAKPRCTRFEDGRVRHPGHAPAGAILARRLLWELDWPSARREAVCGLVRHHMAPYHLMEKMDARRRLHYISQTARCDWLAILCEADSRGRKCGDVQALLDNIGLFRELAIEEKCLNGPRLFASAHSRFLYFRKPDRDPDYAAFDDTRCEVTMLSGLPGAGKDTWVQSSAGGLPVISLDALRDEMEHSLVIAAAREQARVYLRAGQSFVWNATNLSRQIREQTIDLAANYGARVRIIAAEAGASELWGRNARREKAVPEAAIARMLDRWEAPDLTEAHEVIWAE